MRQSFMIALGLFFAAVPSFADEPPKLEPVSSRLSGRLQHSDPSKDATDSIVEIHFSPDGKRLMAGDYPGGIINVWDVGSGKRLATMETGLGFRAGSDYFAVSPDWKTIYSPTRERGFNGEKIEVGGNQLMSWSFNDAVQVFDIESGKLSGSWQHSPPREIRTLTLSPNGAYFLTSDGVPGIYQRDYKRTMSVWNAKTGTSQTLDDRYGRSAMFSPDSKRIALVTKSTENEDFDRTVTIVDAPNLQPKTVIFLPPGNVVASPCAFCSGSSVCVVSTTVLEKADQWHPSADALRFYDVKTGTELFQAPAAEKDEGFYRVTVAPDGQTVAAASSKPKGGMARLLLVTAGSWQSKRLELGENKLVGSMAFHPSGKWLAVSTFEFPKQGGPPPTTLPQPRIQIVDVATGKIAETLIMPQCYPESVAFSPDGKTLATSGTGEVLLWDFSTPPGEKQP